MDSRVKTDTPAHQVISACAKLTTVANLAALLVYLTNFQVKVKRKIWIGQNQNQQVWLYDCDLLENWNQCTLFNKCHKLKILYFCGNCLLFSISKSVFMYTDKAPRIRLLTIGISRHQGYGHWDQLCLYSYRKDRRSWSLSKRNGQGC